MPVMHVALILNRSAGTLNGDRGELSPGDVRDAFTAAGMNVTLQTPTTAHLTDTFRAALRDRPDAIIVGGGDGTISSAAGALAGTGVPLGVLPLGTLNHFASDVGLPAAWRDAVAALARAEVRAIDVAEVNGRVFINNCSIGSYPEAVRKRDQLRREHGRGKWIAMWIASFAVFRRLRRFRVRIDLPDTSLTLRTPFVFIGNNAYSGHLLAQSLRPRLDAGQLAIYTTRAHRRFTIIRLAWQSLVRRIDEADALEIHHASEAVVTSLTGQPLPLAADGELVHLEPPLRFRIRPGALRVLVPAPATDRSPSRHRPDTPPLSASPRA